MLQKNIIYPDNQVNVYFQLYCKYIFCVVDICFIIVLNIKISLGDLLVKLRQILYYVIFAHYVKLLLKNKKVICLVLSIYCTLYQDCFTILSTQYVKVSIECFITHIFPNRYDNFSLICFKLYKIYKLGILCYYE